MPAVPCSNVDVTVVLACRVSLHVPRPVHRPDHPAKVLPPLGTAVNVTPVPLEKLAVQVPGQSIPAGLLVTVPPPLPALVTVSWTGEPPPDPVPTVIVADAEVVPPDPVAVAVYVVVEVGLTDSVPPLAAIVRLLPLVPVIVIPVAFWAVTVRTVELPLVIVVGLAVIVTVGVGELTAAPTAWPLTPTTANAGTAHGISIERT